MNHMWEETQNAGMEKGIFHVYLGSVVPLDLDFDREYLVGISVDSGSELAPRIPLSSAPYAFRAYSVHDGSITTSKLAVWICNTGEDSSRCRTALYW